ncbi:hypothetical protein TSAR_007919, partial [Trichomalopsis sarcophagae]
GTHTPQTKNLHILVNKTQTRTSLPHTLKVIKVSPLASHCSGCLIKVSPIASHCSGCLIKVNPLASHCSGCLITEKAKIIIVVRQDFMLNAILTDDTLTIELSDV